MKAIIIQECDCVDLLRRLELEKLRTAARSHICEAHGVDKSTSDALFDEMHRHFHYYVTRWLQEQGASATGV